MLSTASHRNPRWLKKKELNQFDMALVYSFKQVSSYARTLLRKFNRQLNLLGIKLKHLIATLLQTADN